MTTDPTPRPPRRSAPPTAIPSAPRRAALAIALLAAACAPDGVAAPPRPAARPALAAAADSAPRDSLPHRPAGPGAEMAALFGDAAPRLAEVIAAQRAAADTAAARDVARLVDEVMADGATELPAARRAADGEPRAAREYATREVVSSGGQTRAVETHVVTEPTFDAASGELRLTREAEVSVTPEGSRGRSYRYVTRVAFDVPVCPAADGTVRGRLLATFSSWQLQSAPSAQRADSAHADARRETRMDGEVVVRVNDVAEIESLDLALNLGASWDDGTGPVAGGARLTWPGAPLAALDAFYEPGRLGSRTGDFDAVEALGYGPAEVYVRGLDEVARQVRAARDVWRGGRCVEVVIERGPETNDVLPGTEVELGPRAKSRVDGAFVEPARLLARADGAAVSPLAPVPYPATFGFTMPDGPVGVELRADTRRGVGRKRLLFVRQHNAGSISYAAVASYVVDVTNRGERLYGTVTDSMSVESAIELRAGSFIPGELVVPARNTIFVGGRARVTTRSEGSEEVHTLSLAGTGETVNPAPEAELMRFSFPTHAPAWGPEPGPGTIAFTRRDGRSLYSLSLGVWQFAPTLEWERRAVFSCPQNAVGRSLEVYENVKHTSVTTVEVPRGCTTNRRSKRVELPGPYTFGAIAADRSAPDSVTGSRALISGQYDPEDPSDYITGEETRTLTSCLAVRASDPTGLAQLTLPPFVPVDASGSIPGVRCRLHYRLRWKIPRRPAGG